MSTTRASANQLIEALVMARLSQPDAADLLVRPTGDTGASEAEAAELRARREEIAGLLGEGLLTGSAARPQLETIAERLSALETKHDDRPFSDKDLIDPAAAWASWTMPQRRAVVRLLLERIELHHIGPGGGPKADPTRIECTWREAE